MVRKTTSKRLRLNPNFNKTIDTNLNVWSHDENSYEFRFEFYDDECDIPIDLTGARGRVLLLFKNDGDKKHLLDLEIEDETLGLAKFTVPKRILGYEGTVNAHIYIDFEGRTHDFGNFLFRMKRSAIDEDFPQLDTVYVSEFEKALEEIQEILRKFDGIEMGIDEKIKQIEQAIEQHEREVEQKLNDINASVDDRLTQINNNLDGTEEELNKRIEVIEKDIASNEVVKKDDFINLKEKVDKNKIGGVNYLANSSNVVVGGVDFEDGSKKEYQALDIGNTFRNNFDFGDEVTISFDIEAPKGVKTLQIYNTNKKGPYQIEIKVLSNVPVGKSRQSITTKLIERDNPTLSSDWIEFSSNYGTSDWYKITKIKIEKGNRPTDWSPAPEDLATKKDISNLQKQIDNLEKAITTLGGTL